MQLSALSALLGLSVSVAATVPYPPGRTPLRRQTSSDTASSLWVSEVPSSPQPYAVRHYGIPGVVIGAQTYRFPVTGPSSDYAFTLISTAAPGSGSLGVLPHTHLTHYENFFCLKGQFQLWTSDAETYENEEARLMTPGDYGAVPHNTTHTFQILDPDTDMVGVIQPGGFEDLFYALANANYTSPLESPYEINDASPFNATSSSPPPSVIASLEFFDVYAQLNFTPSRALVNGSYSSTKGAGDVTGWHGAPAELGADDKTPYFVAKDFGPKWLSDEAGFYQIVQPLVTPTQSAGNFTLATIIMSQKLSNESAMSVSGNDTSATAASSSASGSTALTGHSAFEVVEGLLSVEISGETIQLATGDVVFVPAGTAFQYYSVVPYTKVFYISQGADGLDTRLMENGVSGWEYPVWPSDA
ncbi:hypothetical protein diail_11707 [Diaporthe ilicicola]|nr:hypothetical protein diail_11707 [Diaporthe ilicicola]